MRDRMTLLGMDMARRAHRRWLVATIYLGLVVVWVLDSTSGEQHGVLLLVLATILNWLVLGGYGRNGLIKPFATCAPSGAPASWHNDERELARRDRMHFQVYRYVIALLMLGYALRYPPFHAELGRSIVLGGLVLALTLPQALLLWTEPDVELEGPAGSPA